MNVEQAISQERRETLEYAGAIAYALALKNVRPEARFERTLVARLHKGRADMQPHAGWVVNERKYLAGHAPGVALESGEIWEHEVLLLGEDGQLRTVYEEPKREYQDQGQRRVFQDAWLEGYNLRTRRDSRNSLMPVRAVREHDLAASRGDYFLGYSLVGDQPTIRNRHEHDPSVVSERSVRLALGDLAIRQGVDELVGVSVGN